MHPKLFASLLEAIEKWSDENCESKEWQREDFYYPANGDQNMAKAAATVFDAIASASREAEENAEPIK